jgi:S-layer homology domain
MRLRRPALVLCALAVVATSAAVSPSPAAAAAVSDVAATSPIAADVAWVVAQGVLPANSDGTFRPGTAVTRADLAVYLYRLEHLHGTAPACTKAPFADVKVSSSSCGAIAWLSQSGVQPGAPTLKFSPTAAPNRATLATWLYRLAQPGKALPGCTTARYTDVPATSGSCGTIAWAYSQGVVVGTSSTAFAPAAAVTRGVAATALHRAFDVLNPVLGADVSHPQCSTAGSSTAVQLPAGQAFGVVGVNAGRPKTTNPCLAAELVWAAKSAGGSAQPKVQVYVNTANPGKTLASSWPTSGTNRYGTCKNSDSPACAYEYGRARAKEDLGVAAVGKPTSYTWWLDVEIDNSWTTSTALNVAALEGMVAQLKAAKVAGVGLYSSATHWRTIAGSSVGKGSELLGLPSWLTGASDLGGARRACANAALTAGGTVRMTQFTDGTFDRDHSCV